MDQLIEFISNHPFMVAAWVLTLVMFILFERSKAGKAVTPAQATNLINKENAVIIDIRPKKEWDTGHITGAKHIPLADLDRKMDELIKYQQRPIIVVCNLGQAASSATRKLKAAGYEKAVRLAGGMTEWKGQSLPIVK
ncbi:MULTISPECIES: rhodanese-like domain-containing protein [unclassified Neptuniibacter]|uniref:rhodanese-like domain-containing protein n=1 Tax=unclassified Neptuniibacter TaxID=2630693 RepID=UPI0025EF2F83|nr:MULTISPECIES: rhodanese-like domain-containing protein [unclassified Neptuniibacter]|tara:strand:+ start:25668 stop:26081 length:414 start_codon:yes stop_codon:yes gene_type:complete